MGIKYADYPDDAGKTGKIPSSSFATCFAPSGSSPRQLTLIVRRSNFGKKFTHATGAPVADNTNILTAGPRGPPLLQGIWMIKKMAHFDREFIPERRMHAKGWRAMAQVPRFLPYSGIQKCFSKTS